MSLTPIHIRTMQRTDIPYADSLRRIAGWNQTPSDWERFLRMEPNGCFLAEWKNKPAGTATTIIYENKVAWLGMVLVHPDYRRKGIGRALLLKCIEYLERLQIPSIKLDATPEGRPVYEKLGFKPEWNLSRWERPSNGVSGKPVLKETTPFSPEELKPLHQLDDQAFGVSRNHLLLEFRLQNPPFIKTTQNAENTNAFGFIRRGDIALQMGPIVASSDEAFQQLIENIAHEKLQDRSSRFFWDIPDQNKTATNWAKQNGFRIQRTLTRMYLGSNNTPGNPLMQYAIASPELG